MKVLAVVLAFGSALAATAQDNFTVKPAVTYAAGAAGPLVGDFYLPNDKAPAPAIVYIHGGGWVNGSRTQLAKLARELTTQGYAGFAIEYDVNPVHFPASLDESMAAVKFVREHAAEYHIDPTRIAVMGSSAGGELAALVALNGTGDASVKAAVILNGVLDLEMLGDKSKMVTEYLGGKCSELAEACRAASPEAQIHVGAPPFFVGHGTLDETVPYGQAIAFVDGLRALHVPVRNFTAAGGPHTYWAKADWYAANLKEIQAFLELALRGRRPAQ